MSRPDDYRGSPPGQVPTGAVPPGTMAGGWPADPNRAGAGWPGGGGYQVAGPAGAPPLPAAPRARLEPATLFGIAIAALGALNFVFGFLPQVTASRIDESLSVYAVGPAYVPILLLIAGLLALAAFLPGSERSRLAVAAVSVGGAVGAVISLGTAGPFELAVGQASKGTGAVLLAIFGIIQAVVAIGAYVVGSGLSVRASAPNGAPAATGSSAVSYPGAYGAPAGPGQPAGVAAPTGPPPPPGPSNPLAANSAAAAGTGSVGYYAGYAPAPGARDAAASMSAGSVPASASAWAPPAPDERPTGPQRIIGADPDDRAQPQQAPAERELPRVAPFTLDKDSPTAVASGAGPDQAGSNQGEANQDGTGRDAPAGWANHSAPTEVYRVGPDVRPPTDR